MAKVSVIIPVYNVEKYIKKCVDSIVNQTFKDIEIIIVNDGSKDSSIDIIKSYKDKRVKIYEQENKGAAAARNLGIKKATSPYLFFVDSDDFIELNTIEDMYNALIQNKVDMVLCDYYKLMEDGRKEHVKIIPYLLDKTKSSVISMPGPVCKLIKKDYFIQYNLLFLENHYFEDLAIIPFVCAVSKRFIYLEKPYYYYLQREGSTLNKSFYDKRWEDIFDSIDVMYKYFKKNNMQEEYHDELEYIYIEHLLHSGSLRFINNDESIPFILKIDKIMKEKFPKWRKNKYYKKENIKYKIICELLYLNKIKLVKLLLRK